MVLCHVEEITQHLTFWKVGLRDITELGSNVIINVSCVTCKIGNRVLAGDVQLKNPVQCYQNH